LVSLFDFVNKKKLFQGIPADQRFCLLTLAGESQQITQFNFSFLNTSVNMLNEDEREYSLSKSEIKKINPNTLNCPIFDSSRKKDITISLYDETSVLINEEEETNTWGIKYHTIYNMASDSDLFEDNTLEELQRQGFDLGMDGIFRDVSETYLPVWEAKFIHQFDHRFGTFEDIPPEKRFQRRAGTKRVTEEEKEDPDYEIIPRYWLEESIFNDKKSDLGWSRDWIFAFRDIVRVTSDARIAKGTICPMHPFVHTAPVLTFNSNEPAKRALQFTCIFTSFSFEFAMRQSVGGAHLTLYILKQLPMPKPGELDDTQVSIDGREASASHYLTKFGKQLTWSSHSLDGLGDDLNDAKGPYEWDEDQRQQTRATVDALVAKLYGLSKDDFRYILDDYDTLKSQEMDREGKFISKEKRLGAYDRVEIVD
jgi:hypothetical protein